jgi:dTMP kinase
MRRPLEFLSEPLPGAMAGSRRGKLLAFEGPAAAGRTTQADLLRDWLEQEGYPAVVAPPPPAATAGASEAAAALEELAAFALLLENTVIPALGEGVWVLSDGYVFSWVARREARGLNREWLRRLAAFALVPHAAFYLRAEPETLAARAAGRGGFGDAEAALDLRLGGDLCAAFLRYQRRVVASLDAQAKEHGLAVVDAAGAPERVFREILRQVRKL